MRDQYRLQCQDTGRVTMYINLGRQQAHLYNKVLAHENSRYRLCLVSIDADADRPPCLGEPRHAAHEAGGERQNTLA